MASLNPLMAQAGAAAPDPAATQLTAQSPPITQTPPVAQVTPTASEDLWGDAVKLLRPGDNEEIRLQEGDKLTVLGEVLTAAKEKREQCKDRQWKYKKRDGTVIVLRDVFDKMVKWLNKLENVGDFVAQLDSVHLALPWACIKFFLQVSVGDSEKLSSVYDGIEMITNLIGRYAIFEELYLRESSKASDLLKQAITKLYASALTYLAETKRYYGQNTAKRMVKNVLQITDHDVEKLTEDIRSEQVTVDDLARLIDAEYLRKTNDTIKLAATEARTHNTDLRRAVADLNIPCIHNQLSELTKNFEMSKKVELLNWIEDKIPYSKHHETIRSDRLEGFGLWLFDEPQYLQWRTSRSSSLLWLHGNPGSGKTKLMSLLIDAVRENQINPQAEPIAYVYCTRNDPERDRSEPVAIIRSILRQLSCPRPNLRIQDIVARKYQELQEEEFGPRRLTLIETKALILKLLENNSATIVIDALDECIPERRYELLNAIDELMEKSTKQIKIVVSSRGNHSDISGRFSKLLNFSIDAGNNNNDIERFVRLEVQRSIQELRLLNGTVSLKLRDNLIKTLTDGAQGMFLWVALQLQNLCSPRMKFEEDVLHELGQLPKELKDIWCAIYEEVDSAGDTARRIANTALQWLLCAQGRLSAADFVTAVSFDSTGKVVQMDTPKFLDICGNLVAHDTELDVFRFTHLSVREFLETRNDFAPKISHSTAAEICLNTLLTRDWLSSEITWQKATLYQYATLYWPSHIENCRKEYGKSKIGDALTQMFTRDERVAPWFGKWLLQVESASQTLGWDDPLKDKIEQSLSHPETCLFTACTFGFSDVVRQLSKASPPAIHRVNAKGATGLHLASQFGHLDIVRTLLDGGVEIDAQDEGMETALTRACSAGHEDIVALLLERGADRTVQGKKYGTALQVASLHGHKEVAERLLEGVDIDAESGQFGTALQAASLRGHDKVVRVLLQNGANVNALGGEYAETTDLSPGKRKNLNGVRRVIEFLLKRQAELKKEHVREKSPQTQHESIVQLLLDGGIDINIQSSGFGPAIHAASRGGHENVVRTLLASGAEFRMEGGAYGSALQAASVSGSDAVVQLLLEAGADVNVQTGVYNTPLQAACRYQHENIIRMLLARDADVNAQGGVYGSALQAAARTGSKRIVGLLFENQADVNAQGGTYCTALQAASAEGFYEIVRVLLERGADANLRGGKYGSALQAASGAGYAAVVRLLVEEGGAKLDAALQIASLAGHDGIVSYLLSHGADPDIQGQSFGTALQIAAAAGQEKVVQLLLDAGADANDEGKHFGTALQVASAAGNKSLVRLLLDNGADPGLTGGNFGITAAQLMDRTTYREGLQGSERMSPLVSASAAGHYEVVQMLLDTISHLSETWTEEHINEQVKNALEKAASNGYLMVVQLLLDFRAESSIFNNDDLPLQSACKGGHEDIVRLLLRAGASVRAEAVPWLKSPLEEATKANNETIIRLLIDNGAYIDFNEWCGTALHIASHGGFESLVRMFLEKGVDVESRAASEITPLILASAAGHDSVVRLLLQRGANPRSVTSIDSVSYYHATQFGTALQAAAYGSHENVVRLLLGHPVFSVIRGREKSTVLEDDGSDASTGSANDDPDVFYSPPQSPVYDDSDSSTFPSFFYPTKERDCPAIDINKGTFSTALQAASFKGNEKIVRMLLKKGADTNIRGGKYGIPLQAACVCGSESIVRLLLNNGANVNIEGGLFGTALQAASFHANENLVGVLIEAGADVRSQGGNPQKAPNPYISRKWRDSENDGEDDSEDYTSEDNADTDDRDRIKKQRSGPKPGSRGNTATQGKHQCGKYGTALQAAALSGNVEIVRLLLDNGADISDRDEHGQTPLHRASYQGHDTIVELLLERGANVNERDNQGRTALRWVANYGYEKLLGLLSLKRARIDVRDCLGETAMHRAARNGHTHVLQKLIQKGLDVDARDKWGKTALFAAAGNGQAFAVRFLLENGASVNAMGSGHYVGQVSGPTALHEAASTMHHTVVRPLVENGADIDARDENERTPLHFAAARNGYEVPYLLLLYGANIEARDRQGQTALHIAAAQKTTTVLSLLLLKGADVNAEDSYAGMVPLHVAADKGEIQAMEKLLHQGAKIEARDREGRTALHLAEKYDVKLFLLAHGASMDAKDNTGNLAIPYGREPKEYKRQNN